MLSPAGRGPVRVSHLSASVRPLRPAMGKSSTFAVATTAPTPLAEARDQTIGLMECHAALGGTHVATFPRRRPSATPSGASRRPRNSRCAIASSPARRPRQISSTEMAQTHGSTPQAAQTRDPRGGRSTAKRVDENRGIQQQPRHGQPLRRLSPRRCRRTHSAGSLSQSWPVSGNCARAASMSSQRLSSSRPRWISSEMKALLRRAPARWSSSAISASGNAMCILMGLI